MKKKMFKQLMMLGLSSAMVMTGSVCAFADTPAQNSTPATGASAEATMDAQTKAVYDDILALRNQDQTKDYTELAKKAKAAWDALSDAQKSVLEQQDYGDYFSVQTGDASKDNPRNTDGIGKKEILVVSFGTSYNDSRVNTISAIENTVENANANWSVRRGFSSQIIINRVLARDGEQIDNMYQAMDRAVKNNVKQLLIQPTTLMYGTEYDRIVEVAQKYSKKIPNIVIAKPLLSSSSDRTAVAKAVAEDAAVTNGFKDYASTDSDTAYIFMGHGTSHNANMTYAEMQKIYDNLGYKNVFVGTVEGMPENTAQEAVIQKVKDAGYKKVVIRPLMIVAGDHANNDMAGSEDDSWVSALNKAGLEATPQIKGLGEIQAVRTLINAHAQSAMKQFPSKPAYLKVKAGKKLMKITVKTTKGTSFQIQYSRNKSFKGAKKITKTAKKSTTAITVKKLKKGTYYVRTCGVKTNKATTNYTNKTRKLFTNYSSYTAAKKVKIK